MSHHNVVVFFFLNPNKNPWKSCSYRANLHEPLAPFPVNCHGNSFGGNLIYVEADGVSHFHGDHLLRVLFSRLLLPKIVV